VVFLKEPQESTETDHFFKFLTAADLMMMIFYRCGLDDDDLLFVLAEITKSF
jgi:hypothetical protein